MRSRRPRPRLGSPTRLGALALISAVLLMAGQFVAWAGTDPTLDTGSEQSTEESPATSAPAPTTTQTSSPADGPSATAETTGVAETPEVEDTVETAETAEPDATEEDEPVSAEGKAAGDGGSTEAEGADDDAGSDASTAPPSLGPDTVELDADSHCDRATGHVIIVATLTNTGSQDVEVIATDVTFSGDSEGPATVAPGGSQVFTFDAGRSPLPGGTVSFALTWQDGTTETVTARHSPTNACGPAPSGPSLTLEKTGPATVTTGASFSYSITVTNSGVGAASDVVVMDDLHDALTSVSASPTIGSCTVATGNVVTCALGTLGSAGSGTASATITITATAPSGTCPSFPNIATGTHAGGTIPPSGQVDTSVTGCVQGGAAGITIVKTGPDLVHRGDTITYEMEVTLTSGSASLSNVTVTDPRCDAGTLRYVSGDTDNDQTLDQGEAWAYSCTHVVTASDPDPLPNTSTATGTGPNGPVTDTDDHTVDIINPAISVTKQARPQHGGPGDTITYTYVVTNTGDTTLFDVSVDDDKLGHICDFAQLAVGESRRCTMAWTIPQNASGGSVENVVIAEGTDELDETVTDEDDESIDVVLGRTVTPSSPPNNPPAPSTATPPGGLAFTGTWGATLGLGLAAAALLVFGTALLWVGRRREEAGAAE